jgi:hypothetical protein
MKTKNKSILKTMLKLAMLALIVMAVSCSQETVLDPTQNGAENLNGINAKSSNAAKATRAWRGKFTNAADLTIPIVGCIPDVGFNLTTNIISGNMTHLGKIQAGSYGRPQEFTCFLTGENTADVIFHVNYIGAHGDMITTKEFVTITVDFEADPRGLAGTFTNTIKTQAHEDLGPLDPFPGFMVGDIIPIEILEGTGRFEGATGTLYFKNASFIGAPDGLTTLGTWELVGTITY